MEKNKRQQINSLISQLKADRQTFEEHWKELDGLGRKMYWTFLDWNWLTMNGPHLKLIMEAA